ncbi:MAG: histidine kinase [Chitinophagaceae bacterium]|nr:histidine kinase [Chitinophagaceae bacterium]
MIKDIYLRIIFIPLLGIMLPLLSGIITYSYYSAGELIIANVFFILTSFIIWGGSNWIHTSIRPLYVSVPASFFKIASICLASGLYGACIGILSALTWFRFSKDDFHREPMYLFISLCVLTVLVFTLVYEIIFLRKERELDSKLVDEIDRERTQAELQALTNEMDPHFIFNSLNAMNHLILSNPAQAHSFNNKLAQVYKYFLLNKNKELIPLQDELDFIDNYFFLLQLRYDKKLQLHLALGENYGSVMIPPCALQLLIENAIKHNEFTAENPLTIKIIMNGKHLKISNNIKPKPYSINSTNIGLKNLSLRFKLICHKDIVIENNQDFFTVYVPLIKQP